MSIVRRESTFDQAGLGRRIIAVSPRDDICAKKKSRKISARSRFLFASAKQETIVVNTLVFNVSPSNRVAKPKNRKFFIFERQSKQIFYLYQAVCFPAYVPLGQPVCQRQHL